MAFKPEAQKFSSKINTLTIGTGETAITLGGENVLPFYTFDAPIEHSPKVGVAVSDLGIDKSIPGLAEYYKDAETFPEQVKRAAEMPGCDFVVLALDSAHPDGENKSAEECAELVAKAASLTDKPLVIEGCKHIEKDAKLFEKISEAMQGRNILVLSAREENYKGVAAAAGLAYGQKIGAESAVDINLAKQLNVLISQMGVKNENMVMNLGSAAAGYGFEYVASTIDRVKAAALSQNDQMLQMPIMTPVYSEAWSVKESIVSEEDFPLWGSVEERGINMEISTASACLAAGSNAVILKHPESVKTISKLIAELM